MPVDFDSVNEVVPETPVAEETNPQNGQTFVGSDGLTRCGFRWEDPDGRNYKCGLPINEDGTHQNGQASHHEGFSVTVRPPEPTEPPAPVSEIPAVLSDPPIPPPAQVTELRTTNFHFKNPA